jgi:predicted dehydrogenase
MLLNVEKKVRGVRATHVWGETKAFARKAAEEGQIPTIVSDPTEMIGKVDGVMIDHRDGTFHAAAAVPFLKAGLPVFVDKPMTTSLSQAKRLLKLRSECGVPLCTMSSIPYLPAAKEAARKLKSIGRIREVSLYGPGDFRSKYGGIWFYGIHQVAWMTDLLGHGARRVAMQVNGKDSMAVVSYPDGLTVTLHFVVGAPYMFHIAALGHEGAFEMAIPHDQDVYTTTTRIFTKMFRTGKEPFSDAEMLAPIAVLTAMERSLKSGTSVKVPAI